MLFTYIKWLYGETPPNDRPSTKTTPQLLPLVLDQNIFSIWFNGYIFLNCDHPAFTTSLSGQNKGLLINLTPLSDQQSAAIKDL